jgi:hypothetical protein
LAITRLPTSPESIAYSLQSPADIRGYVLQALATLHCELFCRRCVASTYARLLSRRVQTSENASGVLLELYVTCVEEKCSFDEHEKYSA